MSKKASKLIEQVAISAITGSLALFVVIGFIDYRSIHLPIRPFLTVAIVFAAIGGYATWKSMHSEE